MKPAPSAPSEHPAGDQNGLFIGVVCGLLVFLMAARTPLDSDLWWHLRAGEETLRLGQPLLSDTLSYTRAGVDWINHSWLTQVGMALLFRWAGFLGLGLAVAGLAAFSLGWVYRQMSGPPLWRAFLVILARAGGCPGVVGQAANPFVGVPGGGEPDCVELSTRAGKAVLAGAAVRVVVEFARGLRAGADAVGLRVGGRAV